MQSPKDMALVETLAAIAQCAERYVYSTDPDRTRNPGYHPVQLSADMSQTMIPFPYCRLTNSLGDEIAVTQDLEACEPGEEITITLRPPTGNALTDVDAKSLCLQLTPRSIHKTLKDRLVIQSNIEEESNEKT